MSRAIASIAVLALACATASPVAAQGGRLDKLHGVGRIEKDLDYVADTDYAEQKDRLDVYSPAAGQNHPVVIFFHGGGLMNGNKDGSEHVGQSLAAAGIVAVVPNYRLSPGVAHPAHVKDAAAAVAWTSKHIASHGGDPSRIYLSGHSAGAYLAALLGTDERYLGEVEMSVSDLAGIAPISGFFYVDRVAPDRPKTVWGTEAAVWREASPAHYLSADAPPFLFLYADGDDAWRRGQNEESARALRDLGHESVEAIQIEDRDHTGIWQRIAPRDPTLETLVAFVTGS